ncbi:hypothetical protein [Dechloromonas sp. HYN0024]|uniref:hypothetical protein n=1 Tax=Dechloromonas sp. HYN0024 TaxID=2231055 RepID=UPI0013C30ECE|nr:hypothetical protein [Dechloromonas sp. HYN0024]
MGKTLCSPAKAASLVFGSTMLGVLAFQGLKVLFVDDATPIQACLAILIIVAVLASFLAYIVAAFIEKYDGSDDSVDEKHELYGAAMTASMHYLGNAISSFQLIELEVDERATVSKETLKQISSLLANTKYHLKYLSALENPTPQDVCDYILEDLSNS